jgi:hypothetical protein
MTLISPFPSSLNMVAIDRAANRLVVTGGLLAVRSRAATAYLTVVREPGQHPSGDVFTTLAAPTRLSLPTAKPMTKGGEEMRKTPTTTLVVLAIGEASTLVRTRLAAAGQLTPEDQAVLRKLDSARYLAHKADIDRRRRHADEDHGVIPLRLVREERELNAEFGYGKQAA